MYSYAKEYEVETKERKKIMQKNETIEDQSPERIEGHRLSGTNTSRAISFLSRNSSSFNIGSQEGREIGENKEDLANVKGTRRSAKEMDFLQGHLLRMKGIGSETDNF